MELETIRKRVESGEFQRALNLLEQINKDSIETSLLKIEIFRELGFYDRSKSLIDDCKSHSDFADSEIELQVLIEEAYLYYRKQNVEKVKSVLDLINTSYLSLDDLSSLPAKIAYVKSYSLRGNLGWVTHQPGEMIDNFTVALDLGQQINHRYSIIHSLIGLGNASKIKGEFLIAKSYYESALYLSQSSDHQKFEAYASNNLGEVHRIIGNIDQAIEAYGKADQFFSSELSLPTMSVTAFNLGLCYDIKEKYEIAMNYFSYARQLAMEADYPKHLPSIYLHQLLITTRLGQKLKSTEIYQDFLNYYEISDSYIKESMSKLVKAVYHFGRKTMKDRVFAQELFEEVIDKEIEFEYQILAMIFLLEIKIDEYILFKQESELDAIDTLFDQLYCVNKLSPLFALQIHMLQAKLEEQRNNSDKAIELLKSAMSISEQYGLESRYDIIDELRQLRLTIGQSSELTDQSDPMQIDKETLDSYLKHLKNHYRM